MAVDREEASALLADVRDIEDRVRQLITYGRVSDYMLLWGTIWTFGFCMTFFARPWSGVLWLGLETLGLASTVALVAWRRLQGGAHNGFVPLRAGLSVLAIIGFGRLWVHLLDIGWREEITFWPTLLCLLLFLFGLWVGRVLALAAAVIFAGTLLGYVYSGPYLHLWVGLWCGGSMLAGGLWLRRWA